MDDIVCLGVEKSIYNCGHLPIFSHNCNPLENCIELSCQAIEGTNGYLMLDDYSVLMIYYNETFKYVCDDKFAIAAAYVDIIKI